MDQALVGLAEAIAELRVEITKAVAEGSDQPMQFALDSIELTAQAVITKEANGKIGWKIVEAGGSYESARTQTLHLTLTPVWKRSDGTLVRDFTISDVQTVEAGDHVGPRAGVNP